MIKGKMFKNAPWVRDEGRRKNAPWLGNENEKNVKLGMITCESF